MQVQNFSKIRSKIFEKYFFENNASFSFRGCQTLSPDMRVIFLLSIMKEESAFFVSVTNGLTDRQTDGNTLFLNLLVILIPMVYNTLSLLE